MNVPNQVNIPEYNRLIIAIDYGTTYTGVAFLPTVYDQGTPDLSSIVVVTNWHETTAALKIPSEISYSTNSESKLQWGSDISPGSSIMAWTKLQLDRQDRLEDLKAILKSLDATNSLNQEEIRRQRGLPSVPAKEPVDIVGDYLEQVRQVVVRELRKALGHTLPSRLITDIVITVPAIWSEKARNLTFRAVDQAGFTGRNFNVKDIIFVTEPEAAALYSIKSIIDRRDDDEIVGPGDCFVQADLGGGTVDVISYRVEALTPSLHLKQVGVATGYKCGATYVDRAFLAWLQDKLGEDFERIFPSRAEHDVNFQRVADRNTRDVLRDFEQLKRSFSGNGKLPRERSFIRLGPAHAELTDEDRGIENGRLKVTDEDMKSLFDFSLSNILNLVASQVVEIGRAQYRPRYIFLSGGFAQSDYIYQNVRRYFGGRGIHVSRPDDPLVAVCKGAIARRLEQDVEDRVYMRKANKSYGIVVSQPYSPFLHANQGTYSDPFDNEPKVKEQISWLVRKGDLLLSNETKTGEVELLRRFAVNDPKVFINKFISYIGDNTPQSIGEIPSTEAQIVTAQYDLGNFPPDHFDGHEEGYLTARLRAGISLGTNSCWYIALGQSSLVSVPVDSVGA